MVNEGKLVRVGGLLRIRDDYEPVWRLAQDEGGISYIVRVGGDDGEDDRIYVANDDPPTAAAASREPTVLSQTEATERFGDWAGHQMRSEGISRANVSLLELWASHRKTANPQMPGMAGAGPQPMQPGGGGGSQFGNANVQAGPSGQTTELLRGWECPHCGETLPGGAEFAEHQRMEHHIVDGD